MPIQDQIINAMDLISIPSDNSHTPTSTALQPFNSSEVLISPDLEAYDVEVARKLKDLELKAYVAQLKSQGYEENLPIVGEASFTKLIVQSPADLENSRTEEEKCKWVVTRLFTQTHAGVQYMTPQYDESNKASQIVSKLAGVMSQKFSLHSSLTPEEVKFNERLINWALKSNELSPSGTPSLRQIVQTANRHDSGLITSLQGPLGELLTPVISYGMAAHLIDWEEVGQAKISVAQGYIGHVIKNMDSIASAYTIEEECLRDILPHSSSVGRRPFRLPDSFNLLSAIPRATPQGDTQLSTFVEKYPHIVWMGGGAVGVVCVGATIVGFTKYKSVSNAQEIAQIAKGISRLLANGFTYLGGR